jgi:signal peptidase I
MKPRSKLFTCAIALLFLAACGNRGYKMSTSTMEPTIKEGDVVRIENTTDIGRNEIVAFQNAASKDVGADVIWISRVVGVPGDTIQVSEGKLYVNGVLSEHNHPGSTLMPAGQRQAEIFGSTESNTWNQDNFGPLRVPKSGETIQGSNETAGEVYFLMGDNRSDSYDSRFFGFVKKEEIRGRVDY